MCRWNGICLFNGLDISSKAGHIPLQQPPPAVTGSYFYDEIQFICWPTVPKCGLLVCCINSRIPVHLILIRSALPVISQVPLRIRIVLLQSGSGYSSLKRCGSDPILLVKKINHFRCLLLFYFYKTYFAEKQHYGLLNENNNIPIKKYFCKTMRIRTSPQTLF